MERVIIVGAGPIGIACGIAAKRRGVDPLIIDAGAVANSIVGYPVGMGFFTTPELMEVGGHPVVCGGAKPTREEALKYYRGVVRTEGLRVRTYTRLVGATPHQQGMACQIHSERRGNETIVAQRVIIATGYFDHPNPLDVPGHDLPHVHRYFDEGHRSYGLRVVVIGGKNSAVEAALELFRAGAETTLVYRGSEFSSSVKYWVRPDIENRIAAGEIRAMFETDVVRIDPQAVIVRPRGQNEQEIPADRVYALIGYRPDLDLFARIGIELHPETGRATINPDTMETNVPGIFMAGSTIAGYATSDIFIENGRFDGEKIFGDWR